VIEALLRVITRWDPEMVAGAPRSDELDAALAELLADVEEDDADWHER
jgi:hypothetical protein